MLKEMLQYQKMDASLVKIEQELENSESKRVVNQMVEQVRSAQNKLVSIERSASQLIADYEKLKQEFEEASRKLDNAKNVDYSAMSESALRDSSTKINQQIASMLSLNKEITRLSKRIVSTLNEFETTKQSGVLAKKKYNESMAKYDKFASDKTHKIEEIKAELKKLEQQIDPKMLERYKVMRKEHKFPIFVPLVNNCCGVCAMQLPNARLDLLKKNRVLECENCHRMIYIHDAD